MGKRRSAVIAAATAGVLAMLVLLIPASATAAPTLTLSPRCDDYPPFSEIAIELSGLPPSASFVGTIEFSDDDGGGGVGPATLNADANGDFSFYFGSEVPSTYTVTVEIGSVTLVQSLHVDCSTPSSKADCKDGGWRRFGFRNQGQCVASVAHASKRHQVRHPAAARAR